jgi:hypothetical protein
MPRGHCATISPCRAPSVHLAETRRNEPQPERALTDETGAYFIAERAAVRHNARLIAHGQPQLAIPDTFTYNLSRFGWLPADASPSKFADILGRWFAIAREEQTTRPRLARRDCVAGPPEISALLPDEAVRARTGDGCSHNAWPQFYVAPGMTMCDCDDRRFRTKP